ncbi:glycosyltransferase [Clostridium sp. Marseille-P3244]|uniref:glycosyltransferase n=1 Tax=Clostridium sp. Marseille-P3244 TaxID=1871020 RepID=UPI0009314C26|nr:glycosyltransferase [Clostridium sp. Marseille-P3244]
MKIAMLTNNYRPFVGGVPISVERQAQELIRLGNQVTVFAPMYGESMEEREKLLEEDRRAPERVVRYCSQKKKMDNGMVYPAVYPKAIIDIFAREHFDCIHVHHPMFVGPWGLWLGKKYRIPVVYTYHTRYEDYLHYLSVFRVKNESLWIKKKAVEMIRKQLIPFYMGWFAGKCDLVLAPSEGMKKVIREYGVKTPTEVLPTGLDETFFRKDVEKSEKIRQKYGRGKKNLLVTVSRLEKEKNYGFLIRGIAEIRRKMGDDFHVLILGDGSQKSELKTRASILGVQDMITFVGSIPNESVKDYLYSADLFLFASKSETQGIVLAEAMAAGCPVVAVQAVGVDDIVEDGINGFLTAEEEEEWSDRVIEALREENYKKMQKAAFRTAANYRSSTLAIYEEMLYNQYSALKTSGGETYEDEETRREHSAMAVH